ncbi:TPA: hypothetical protein ACXJQL_003516, partial [Stenotrophomonas maltophilia]
MEFHRAVAGQRPALPERGGSSRTRPFFHFAAGAHDAAQADAKEKDQTFPVEPAAGRLPDGISPRCCRPAAGTTGKGRILADPPLFSFRRRRRTMLHRPMLP